MSCIRRRYTACSLSCTVFFCLSVLWCLLFAAPAACDATFTVSNINSTGAGSLHQAILNANAASGADTIAFNIPSAGIVHTIAPTSPLPPITEQVTIDGFTQPGSSKNTLA
jgi:hypothetical protein